MAETREERRRKAREEERRRSEELDRLLEQPKAPAFTPPATGIIVENPPKPPKR